MNAERELTDNELRDDDLEQVVGGKSGSHIPEVTIEVGDGGGGGTTPAGAWNACLKVLGYPPQA